MKRYFKYFVAGLAFLSIHTSCSDFLDKKPLTEVSDTDVWSDPLLVNSFVNARYNQIGHGFPASMLASVSDETVLQWDRGTSTVNYGTMNSSDLGRMNGGWDGWDNRSWSIVWGNLMNCNLFLENVDEVPFDVTQEDLRERLKGEVRFIRALMYWDLVARWGAMPLITKSFTLDDVEEIISLKRASYKECIDFIVSELEAAAKILPAKFTGSDTGRATSMAALALRSRVLLYAASDLMNVDVKSEVVGYTSPESDRWEKAAKAAQEAIDFAQNNGYALYNKYTDKAENYYWLFLEWDHEELIFVRQGTTSALGDNLNVPEQYNYPNGYYGWGGNCPIQAFIDAFEMEDGTTFDWNNPQHAADPYAKRDPRFYASILYDGAPWKDREVETHYLVDASGTEYDGGLDSPYGNESWNSSQTAYNMKKFMDETYNGGTWVVNNPKYWIWLRLGEQYLNLAEALYRTGDEAGARSAVNVIRKRAGMPDIPNTVTGTELWEKIKNERRIELCFEEHRYYDVRRWREANEYCNGNIYGIYIAKYPDGTKIYTPNKSVVETRTFHNDRMNWLPILRTERDKNPNLEQNPGYTD